MVRKLRVKSRASNPKLNVLHTSLAITSPFASLAARLTIVLHFHTSPYPSVFVEKDTIGNWSVYMRSPTLTPSSFDQRVN